MLPQNNTPGYLAGTSPRVPLSPLEGEMSPQETEGGDRTSLKTRACNRRTPYPPSAGFAGISPSRGENGARRCRGAPNEPS